MLPKLKVDAAGVFDQEVRGRLVSSLRVSPLLAYAFRANTYIERVGHPSPRPLIGPAANRLAPGTKPLFSRSKPRSSRSSV